MSLRERVPTIDRDGLSERVYTRLKEAILAGRFAPGERLSAEEMAKHFAVSITPVRDALKRLEGDALVEVIPRQGVFVAQFSQEAIREIFEIRLLIERGCLESLAEVPDASIQQVHQIVDQMELLRDDERFADYSRFIELDSRFHAAIVTLRGNQRLLELYSELQWPLQVVRGLARAHYHRAAETVAEHRAIVAALQCRDVAQAQVQITVHLHNAMEDLLRHMALNARDERRQP
jgi:DNA-binding GntR family transcriptional regulator